MANRWKGNLVSATAATSSGTVGTGKANGVWGLNSQIQQKQAGLWSIVPLPPSPAPVITSVTAGDGNVIVDFTLPTQNITGVMYTATSTPGGFQATGNTASYLYVGGLTNGVSYTFVVSATNSSGATSYSDPSASATPMMPIGAAYGGGYYAGQIMENGTKYNLVISPKATGTFTNKTMGNGTDLPATQPLSTFDGLANTNALVTANSSGVLAGTFSGAASARGLTIGGYNDWYMPAQYEMEVLYYYLKPTTQNNITSGGHNPYAVAPEPVNTNYTISAPPQTSVAIFQTGGSESIEALQYWVSNMAGADYVADWSSFGAQYGRQYFTGWYNTLNIRAIRKVAA